MSYYSSRYTSATKPIIRDARYESQYDSHYGSSRASSTDSRGSYYSSSSTDYSSRRSCGGSSEQRADDEWQRKHRVPDNSKHPRLISTTIANNLHRRLPDNIVLLSQGQGRHRQPQGRPTRHRRTTSIGGHLLTLQDFAAPPEQTLGAPEALMAMLCQSFKCRRRGELAMLCRRR